MTEKRFTSDYNGDEHLFTHFLENGKPMTKEEVLNKLNGLNDENQRLKLENDGLRYALKNIKQIDVEIDIGDVE